jgi:hypothetical protein
MKRLLFILILCFPILVFGQQDFKRNQITQDTARLKNLSAHPDSILGYGTLYSKGDSIYFMDQNENIYNILLWIDSVAALRSSITSLSGDQNDIANNTWFTSYDGLGNPMNAWKVNDQGVIEFGTNVAIGSLYTVADAGSVWIANMPVVSSVYGTKMEYKIGIDDSGIFRVLGYSDGGGAIYGPEVVVTGNMTVTGDVGITGDVTITGDIGLTGKLTASDSVLVPLRAYNATTYNNSKRAMSEDAFRDKVVSEAWFSSNSFVAAGVNNTNTAVEYVGTGLQTAGKWNSSAVDPTETQRLNYEGYLFATKLYVGGTEVTPGAGFSSGDAHTWTAEQTFNDNVKISLGTAGADGSLYSNGTDALYEVPNGGKFHIRSVIPENIATFISNGAVILYYDNQQSLATQADAVMLQDNISLALGSAGVTDTKLFWDATTLNIASSNYHYLTNIGGTNLFNTNATGVNIPTGKTYQVNGASLLYPSTTATTTPATWNADDVYGVTRKAIKAYGDANWSSGTGSSSTTEVLWNNAGTVDGFPGVTYSSGDMVFSTGTKAFFGTPNWIRQYSNELEIIVDNGGANTQGFEVHDNVTNVLDYHSSTQLWTISNLTSTTYLSAGSYVYATDYIQSGTHLRAGTYLRLPEITTPTATTNFGQVYTKTDNKIYFQDGGGTEHEIAFAVPPEPSVPSEAFIFGMSKEKLLSFICGILVLCVILLFMRVSNLESRIGKIERQIGSR